MTPTLAEYTTLGLGGPAGTFVAASSEPHLIEAVRAADAVGDSLLLIGGGSNLVIADDGFPGTVIHVNTRGLDYRQAADAADAVEVTVAAGEDWDGVVAAAVAEGLAGLESLSGIPGRAGATPIQNVGAYGREVAEVITQVRVYDRQKARIQVIPNERCSFTYRSSLFKSAGLSSPGGADSPHGGLPPLIPPGPRTPRGESDGKAKISDMRSPGAPTTGGPLDGARSAVATVRSVYGETCMVAEASVLRGRRRGNLVIFASDRPLPEAALRRAAAADPFPARVVSGDDLLRFVSGAPVVTDATVMTDSQAPVETSPQPTNW